MSKTPMLKLEHGQGHIRIQPQQYYQQWLKSCPTRRNVISLIGKFMTHWDFCHS